MDEIAGTTLQQHLPVALLILLLLLVIRWLWQVTGRAAEADWGSPWANRIDGINRLFCKYYHRLQGDTLYLPEEGPAIVVANHISGLDPLLLIAASKRRLRFIIATEQYNRFGFQWLFRLAGCIPVDRKGRPERAFRAALKALADGEVVALFPHGAIHLEGEPYRKLKPGAVRLAQLADCPIFPARISGVRSTGDVILPVLLRARAKVENFPLVDCSERDSTECLDEIEHSLIGG